MKFDSKTDGAATGTQSLLRGLRILECVAEGHTSLKALTEQLGAPRSTMTRALSSLAKAGYIYSIPYKGYFLGPKLMHLGERAAAQLPLIGIARPALERLSAETRDCVYMGVLDQQDLLYILKIPGERGLQMRSEVGSRNLMVASGVGKSMLMHLPEDLWPGFYETAERAMESLPDRPPLRPYDAIAGELRAMRRRGWTLDLEESEYGVRCVAAPVFDHNGRPVAAVSVASAETFLPLARTEEIGPDIRAVAEGISRTLGWSGETDVDPPQDDDRPAGERAKRSPR